MSKENASIQAALKDSINAKLIKEGEVTILRKGIEKVFCIICVLWDYLYLSRRRKSMQSKLQV